MRTYGLIGYPLGHSFSERYFTDKFLRENIRDCVYRTFPIDSIDKLRDLTGSIPSLCGLNVTIPYKEQVIPFLDDIDPQAGEIGAVNCIRLANGRMKGYNTDAYGFRNSLLSLIGDARPNALVLGSGGASKAVCYVLRELGMDFRVVSRRESAGTITYGQLNGRIIAAHGLIVNTTPLGMFPDIEKAPPLPYRYLTGGHFLYDLIYNPARTKFLALGEECGAAVMNGSQMLVGQAERSWNIWNDKV